MAEGGADKPSYVVRDQKFDFTVSGLKVKTKHNFYFDGSDKSSKCAQSGKKIGDALISDDQGSLSFSFYYSSDIDPSSSVSKQLSQFSKIAGVKKVSLKNVDGTSFAETTITFAELNPATTKAINANKSSKVILATL